MTLTELIDVLANKVAYLSNQCMVARQMGDLARLVQCERELTDTQTTLDRLRTLV